MTTQAGVGGLKAWISSSLQRQFLLLIFAILSILSFTLLAVATYLFRDMVAASGIILLCSAGLFVTVLTGFGLWVGVKRLVLDRLGELQIASERLAGIDLQFRVATHGSDEIAGLGSSFNRMAARIGQTHVDLSQAELFLQAIIDAVPDGIRVISSDFTIIKTNRHYGEMLGADEKLLIGTKCYRSSHGRNEPCPHTMLSCPVHELAARPEERIKTRQYFIRGDSTELAVEISAVGTELDIGGRRIPVVIESIRDLNEQARISQEQRLSEIGFLATGVAHEIHNPLSSIALALGAFHIEGDRPHDESNRSYIETARTEINKCLKVTDSLMRLSQPPEAEHHLLDAGAVIASVLSLVEYQASAKGIVMDLSLPRGLRVLADEGDLRMIAINLVQNAFHAMSNGGTLRVSCERDGNSVLMKFSDTGIGIAPENLDRIFLPFWTKRADGSPGHGLGLTICRTAVERSGGTIHVDSRIGSGTSFTIRMPDADRDVIE